MQMFGDNFYHTVSSLNLFYKSKNSQYYVIMVIETLAPLDFDEKCIYLKESC